MERLSASGTKTFSVPLEKPGRVRGGRGSRERNRRDGRGGGRKDAKEGASDMAGGG